MITTFLAVGFLFAPPPPPSYFPHRWVMDDSGLGRSIMVCTNEYNYGRIVAYVTPAYSGDPSRVTSFVASSASDTRQLEEEYVSRKMAMAAAERKLDYLCMERVKEGQQQ